MKTRSFYLNVLLIIIASALFPGLSPAGDSQNTDITPAATGTSNRATVKDLVIEFSAGVSSGSAGSRTELMEGDYADIRFQITDEKGAPVTSHPSAWMDISADEKMSCRDKIGLFVRNTVGLRPLIDLNSYFILAMNRDSSISVIDPYVGITGKTNLFAMVLLKQPGADWAKSRDNKRLYVTMPRADEVAIVDAETFKVISNVGAGKNPVHIALQPDEKYLWIGNDAKENSSTVTVIDTNGLSIAAQIPLANGRHELAFTSDSRYAFVSSQDGGTVSVIDVQKLKIAKDLKVGLKPVSVAFSPLSKALYVADAEGVISVIGGERHEVISQIKAKPGLGSMSISPDGRYGLVVNPKESAVHIFDTSDNRLLRTAPVGNDPYQIAFSKSFAYIRCLGTEQVSMISISDLGKDEKNSTIVVGAFGAGTAIPREAGGLGIANGMIVSGEDGAVLVASPGDGNIQYYMEGMAAPMGTFRNYGHFPVAVEIVDRSLKEEKPGVYTTTVRIPAAGNYDVPFLLSSLRVSHCFSVSVKPNPLLKHSGPPLEIEYLMKDRAVKPGGPNRLVFRLIDPETRKPKAGLKDVRVSYYMAPGLHRAEAQARETEDGLYEAELNISQPGAYYVSVASPSMKVSYSDLPYLTLQAGGERSRKKPGIQPLETSK